MITVAFAILTLLAKQTPYFSIDLKVTRAVQEIRLPWFASVMDFLTFLGYQYPSLILIVTVCLILLFLRRRLEVLFLIISTYGGYEISILMKNLVGRARPNPILIHQVTKYVRNDSFPSGHVLFYVSFFGFLIFLSFTLMRKGRGRTATVVFLLTLIALIGPSRIYLGAHWFSDVLGAYLLGLMWLTTVIAVYNRLKPHVVPQKLVKKTI